MHITLGASISSVGTVQQWPEQGKHITTTGKGKDPEILSWSGFWIPSESREEQEISGTQNLTRESSACGWTKNAS